MRISVFLLLVPILQTFAGTAYSQKARISVNFSNTRLVDALDEIEDLSEFYFLYNEKLVDTDRAISISADNQKIETILDELFAQTDVVYTITDRKIILAPSFIAGKTQQKKTLSGIVTDDSGEPLPGVTVLIKGTIQGTITDVDGNYSIANVSPETILVFSFVGMKTKEIAVGSQSSINVKLEMDAIGLQEVVAVGYGTQRKMDITGAVSSVKANDLNMVTAPSVSQMLAGKSSGVNVTQNSAQPGGGLTILIRGAASTGAGNEPLFVVDGFPLSGGGVEPGNTTRYEYGSRNPLNSINPYDIESIEILKDASATAIYGARAANGVVLITTKKGTKGAPVVTYNTNYSVQKISKELDMLNASEFMDETNKLMYEEWLYLNRVAPYGNTDPSTLASKYIPKYTDAQIAHAGEGTDWLDLVTRDGMINQHNISVTGGNDYTRYAITGNYFDQEGVLKNNDFNRYSIRSNIEQKLGKRFNTGINLTLSQIDNRNAALGSEQYELSGILTSAISFPAFVPVRDAYGDYSLNPINSTPPNPVSLLEIEDITTTKRILGNAFLEADIIDGLKVRLNAGIDNQIGNRNTYLPKTTKYGAQVGGDASKSESSSFDKLLNATINYKRSFVDKHKIDVLLGYEYQQFNSEGFSARSTGFFTDAFLYNSLGTGELSTPQYISSGKSRNELASYFSRFNYSFRDKYYLTLTGRVDGSTKFGANNKYAFFPSGALSWRLIEENFIKDLNVFSDLKLRVSYGNSGNQNIGQNSLSFYNSSWAGYRFGESLHTGTYLSQIENPNLKWETTTQFNVGLDMGLVNNRVSLSMEYYKKIVKDLLDFRQLPTFSVVQTVADNIGKTQSEGFELTLKSYNTVRAFKWNTDFTFTTYEDRWKERNPDVILASYQKVDDPIRPIYGYQGDGLLGVDEAPPLYMPDLMPGQDKIKDLNGLDENGNLTGEPDGKITSADMVLLGTYDPSIIIGVGNTFRFKNFDLNVFFNGMFGRKMKNENWGTWGVYYIRSMMTGKNMMSRVKERWSHDNTDATMSSGMINLYDKPSQIENGSFLRCKNITLGYTVPNVKKVFSNLRVYVDVQNPFVITNYSGLDPETDSRAGYPNQTNYSVGLDVTF